MFRKSLTVGALALLVGLGGSKAFAQYNPNGWIRTNGWTHLFPILNTYGAAPSVDVLAQNWVAPHDLSTEDPRAGDFWNDIDFANSPGNGFNLGGLSDTNGDGTDEPIWYTLPFLAEAFGVDPSVFPNSDLVNYQDEIVNVINNAANGFPTTRAVPGDNVMSIAQTYVNNTTGDYLAVNVCTASDDSVRVDINNIVVALVSSARGSAGDCQERNPAFLPPGVSRVVCSVWEGGGGHNFRLALEVNGVKASDANSATTGIEFLGPGEPGDDLTGQEQIPVVRSQSSADEFNCPVDTVGIAIQAGAGDDAQAARYIETLSTDNPTGDAITVSNISAGGVVSEETLMLAEGVNSSGFLGTLLVLGPIVQGGGAAPPNDALDAQYLGDDVDETDPAYRPAAGDTTNGVVQTAACGTCDAINPGGTLTWNVVTGVAATFNYNNYYGGDVNDNVVYTAFYFCLDEDKDVYLGIGSDDSYMIRIDGEAISRFSGGRGYGNNNQIQNFDGPVALSAGKHFLMMKVFEGGGGHGSRIGLFDADRNPLQGVTYDTSPDGDTCASPLVPVKETTTITWDTTIGTMKDPGLSYDLSLEGAGNVNIAGLLEGAATTTGVSRVAFPEQTGALGVFDNAHLVGNATEGSLTLNGDVYTQTANGSDIWTGGDHMYFAYKKVTGDFTVKANILNRYDAASGGSEWGKHGLMARQSCDVASKFVMIQTNMKNDGGTVATPHQAGRNVHLDQGNMYDRYDARDGALPGYDAAEPQTVNRRPQHMMMARRGDVIYTYLAFDDGEGNPLRWAFLGSDDQQNRPATQLVGMAVTSHTGNAGPTVALDYTIEFELGAPARENAVPGAEITSLTFEDAADLGITVGNAPTIVDGRLRLTTAQNSQTAAVYYGVAASGDNSAPLLEEGFAVEFDAFISKPDGSCLNSADGMGLTIIGTGGDDGLASAVAPQPQLEIGTLIGGGGGAMAYAGGGFDGARAVNHQSFTVELEDWKGCCDNEPANGGTNNGECNWHAGINVTGNVNSLQTNVDFGVPLADMPDIFSPAGIHAEVIYQPTGWVDVYVSANDGSVGRTHVVSKQIAPLIPGDVVIGFTSATGGANANHDIDNVVLSSIEICDEDPDSVTIDGCPADEMEHGSTTTLTANFSGANGAVTYAWSVSGGTIVGAANGQSVEIMNDAEGTVTATVSASDASCGDVSSAACSYSVGAAPPTGVDLVPGDANLDGSVNISDPVAELNDLFGGIPLPTCLRVDATALTAQGTAILDWNGDGSFNISDPVGSLNNLFGGAEFPDHVLGSTCQSLDAEGTCEATCTVEG